MKTASTARIIRKKELLSIVGLSDATVYRMEKAGEFPLRLRLGAGSCGWMEDEVTEWIEQKKASR